MTKIKKTEKIIYKNITLADFSKVIALGNQVHGEGYLNNTNLTAWVNKGITEKANAGYVAYDGEQLVGFRLTYAIGQWQIDKWCSPKLWRVPSEQVCYFKCNTVAGSHRGLGIGKKLLRLSIEAAKQQGATAGASHLWKQSPNNSAVMYFSKCGGEHVTSHPDKWHLDSKNGYDCILCGFDCHCEAAEMIIYFD